MSSVGKYLDRMPNLPLLLKNATIMSSLIFLADRKTHESIFNPHLIPVVNKKYAESLQMRYFGVSLKKAQLVLLQYSNSLVKANIGSLYINSFNASVSLFFTYKSNSSSILCKKYYFLNIVLILKYKRLLFGHCSYLDCFLFTKPLDIGGTTGPLRV